LATGVVAITPDQEIYLVGQYRYAMEEYSWEIIEGGVDDGEEPVAAARRELKEEAGIVAARFEPFGEEVHLSNCHSSERAFLYIAPVARLQRSSPSRWRELSWVLASPHRGACFNAMGPHSWDPDPLEVKSNSPN
jgi:8-oxo-dGTP pyrophosphatase MutT (NUDIX family)